MIQNKIKTRQALARLCQHLRSQNKTIGFTSGAFDLLHAGHVDYLEKAGQLCDVLIVAVNSDLSVKKYKGPDRPIIPLKQRLLLVAALESVDYVFSFNERRNKRNIEALKPDFYIKAGDYLENQLTSSEVVEKFGGKVSLIPLSQSVSTSEIIDRIRAGFSGNTEKYIEFENTVYYKRKPSKTAPAVFFDRDGTINEELDYLDDPKSFRLLPHVRDGMKKIQDLGYRIVILTNQPGIGMGYYTKQDFYRVNKTMLSQLSGAGILVDKIYFCPHSMAENCECRKPGLALVERARTDLNLDLSRSIIIGDRSTDIATGKRAGMKTILVKTGAAGRDGLYQVEADYQANNLLDAADWILRQEREG
jgi:rfaE bifunctional protein nucleotidyltransferase chain/domain